MKETPTPTEAKDKDAETFAAFNEAVNMTPAVIAKFLDAEESQKVGWKGENGKGSGESVGHASGRRIIEIKKKKRGDLSDVDYAHMAKVVSYVSRYSA